jgi:ParB-like chromosome segregation protein Spo0J
VITGLKASPKRVGRLYPMLLDKHGNLIDGRHRFAADEDWPKMRLEHVETEEDRLVARLISNVCRRDVSAGEKSGMLGKLGEIYFSEGLKPGRIAYKIAEERGMSYRWVMQYLSDKYKERLGLGGPSKALKFDKSKEKTQKSKVARHATVEDELLFSDPQEKILTIKNYANTGFVNIILEKRFYMKVEKIAEEFGTKPDTIINNMLLLTMKKLESTVNTR